MSSMQVKMSLDTLLEAARYLELQEELTAKLRQAQTLSPSLMSPLPPLPPLQPRPPSPPVSLLKQELTAPVPATSTTTATTTTGPRIIHNSFDIINPLVIDEGGEQKRKQPPMAFRSGTREVHNKLEKHRRAHLKECFDVLKRQLPGTVDEKKSSNLSILHSAFCHIQSLKRRERELEHEMERLAREKIAYQQRLAVLKKEVAAQCDGIDFSALLPDVTAVSQPNHETSVISEGTQETRTTESPNTTTGDQRVLRTTSTLQRPVVPVAVNGIKENNQMQTAALSVLPVGYPMSQGLVLQKVALVPKGLTDLSPLVSSPAVHFIAAPQQIGGKVVPLVNAQYVVKPVVVVSTPSRSS